MKLIIGLGNPGKEYVATRHNIGFIVLDDYLGEEKWSQNEYANFVTISKNSEKVIFIKPTTFMNLSGNAVRYFVNYYKIEVEDILIIHDDMDVEFGNIKLKINSGSGGHNGVQSIIDNMQTDSFLRLKVGISKPDGTNAADYVLHNFSKKEKEILEKKQLIINNIIDDFINNESAEFLMNKYNGLS